MSVYVWYFKLLLFYTLQVGSTLAEDVLGCGGFVKSEIEINYSRVELKLYTKQGSLKYQTDCAPNNGYYFLPMYEKGEYVLKIEPPVGWDFEPREVNLHVDGSTDPCSRSEDINFYFKGFGVTGKVVSKGSDEGPSGVTVTLKDKDQNIVQEIATEANGFFVFSHVKPGTYVVTASHPAWNFVKSEVTVDVQKDTGNVGTALVVAGYDVTGYVSSDGEPIKGVSFVLFGEGSVPGSVEGCSTEPLPGFQGNKNLPPMLCHVSSDESGRFVFPELSPGKYRVVAFYKGENIKFDVRPSEQEFVVPHGSLMLSKKFEVKGFSVSGRVVKTAGGKGVSGASVYVDGKLQTTTKADGVYHLENMQAGTYKLHVKADDTQFRELSVKVTPKTPVLPEIVASHFRVCGQARQDRLPSGVQQGSRTLHLISVDGTSRRTITTDADGSFCEFMEPGQYKLGVNISEDELKRGLKFAPLIHHLRVENGPVNGIIFSQFRAKVSGEVVCAPGTSCGNVKISLQPVGESYTQTVTTAVKNDGTFSFSEVLPGRYEAKILKEEWCWEHPVLPVSVSTEDVTSLSFKLTGFWVTFISSHDTLVSSKSQTGVTSNLAIQKGTSKVCVSKTGVYDFTPVGCHTFLEKTVRWDSSTPTVVQLTAVAHVLSGFVVSKEKANDITVKLVVGENKDNIVNLGPLKAESKQVNGKYKYKIEQSIKAGESVEIQPSAEKLLFYPPNLAIQMERDCMIDAFELVAKEGKFINGKVVPALVGVTVTVTGEGLESPVIVQTDSQGKYSFGPLHSEASYSISAEKKGYIISKTKESGIFEAYKLAEIIVQVVDEEKTELQGVLLSLSGGDGYRQNSQTGTDGKMSFMSLGPGDYFLRPMMKEYKFDPPSKMIKVQEGATVTVQVKGRRTAFSCFGKTTSLTGEPEKGVVIEAVGVSGPAECKNLQEEGISDSTGMFRIRGLIPQCEYSVQLKKGADINQQVERATPESLRVKVESGDVTGVRFIVLRPFNQLDMTAMVFTNSEYLKTLKVKLFREDLPDSPLHSVKLERSSFVLFPPLPMDDKTYFVQLESSLSRATYNFDEPSSSVRANVSYRHVKLYFNPTLKPLEQDMVQGSHLALPLVILLVIAGLNHRKIAPYMMQASAAMQSVVTPAKPNDSSETPLVESTNKRKMKPRKT